MIDHRQLLLECLAAGLLAMVLGACGDLKPNTRAEPALAGSEGERGAGESAARDGGAELETDGGTADGLPSSGEGAGGVAGLVGAAGAGTAAGTGGAAGAEPGAGGTAGQAGTGGAGFDAGGSGGGDAGLDASAGTAGSGSGPDAVATSITVHGRLVNAWNLPLVGVALSLGDQTLLTGEAGEFTAQDVRVPYDVAFVVRETAAGGNTRVTDGWSFQGLTRSDPTFWVYRAGTIQSGTATFTPSGVGSPAPSIELGIGFPYGRARENVAVSGTEFPLEWHGDAQTPGTAHALSFVKDPTSGLPNEYQAHFSTSITLERGTSAGNTYSVDLAPPSSPIAVHELSGDIVSGVGDRVNQVWLSFPDHAALLLAQENRATATFSYLVPELTGATVTVYASAGASSTGSFALAHRSRAATSADASRLQIVLPNPPVPIEPGPAATLTPETVFRWQTDNAVSVVTLLHDGPRFTRRIHVVTAAKSAQIPEQLSSLLEPDDDNVTFWFVEAHGRATSLDVVTSAEGFLDPFADDVHGPLGADGSYAASSGQMLVVPASP